MGRNATSANAHDALFRHICIVGGFGDLGDPMVATLRGVSGDVVTVYAYYETKRGFFKSLALQRANHNPCQRCEMTDSTKTGLVNGPVYKVLMQFFIRAGPKRKFSKLVCIIL